MSVVERVPSVEVVAPDGAVRLFAPTATGTPWQAQVWQAGTPRSVEVAWTRTPGEPSRYVCERHGLHHRRDGCEHIRAALTAHHIYAREERTTG